MTIIDNTLVLVDTSDDVTQSTGTHNLGDGAYDLGSLSNQHLIGAGQPVYAHIHVTESQTESTATVRFIFATASKSDLSANRHNILETEKMSATQLTKGAHYSYVLPVHDHYNRYLRVRGEYATAATDGLEVIIYLSSEPEGWQNLKDWRGT